MASLADFDEEKYMKEKGYRPLALGDVVPFYEQQVVELRERIEYLESQLDATGRLDPIKGGSKNA